MRGARWFPAGSDLPIVLDGGSAAPMFVMQGVTGIEAPAWSVTTTSTPGVPGARFQSAQVLTRSITVPVYLSACSRVEMRRAKAELVSALNPQDGPGLLELSDAVGTADGVVRVISAVYDGGLEGDEDAMSIGGGATWWQFTLQFVALDPFWHSPEPVVASWVGKPAVPFFPFTLPFQLSPSGVTEAVPLDLDGDAETFGTYRLYAPFSRVRATCVSADPSRDGLWWELGAPSAAADMVMVNTKPGEVAVRLLNRQPDGSYADAGNGYGSLVAGSQFWPLGPGDTVRLDVDGAVSSSLFELEARPAWLTAP